MSAIAENLRRQRLPLLTVAALLVLGAAAWTVLSLTTREHLTTTRGPSPAPAVEQAEWKIDYSSGRRYGKLSKAEQARFATQKDKATVLIQDLYDGIFLEPGGLAAVIETSFSEEAAGSLDTSRLGFPPVAREVKTTKRTAHIALDATTAAAAIGRVTVLAQAHVNERPIQIKHESTLWMERDEKGWRVIAFDVKQTPVK